MSWKAAKRLCILGAWNVYAKGFSISCQTDMELLSLHSSDLAINIMGYLLITVLASGIEVMDLTSLIGSTEGEKIGMAWGYCNGYGSVNCAALLTH